MLKLLIELATAWNQVGLLLGAGFFAGISVLLLGNRLYWRSRATYVDAAIIGVRRSQQYFYPVYRYTLTTGPIEAISDTGSSSYRGMSTGRAVRLMAFASHPDKVSDANSYLIEIISVILLSISSWIIYVALTRWPVNTATLVVLLGMLGYFVIRAKALFPRPGRPAPPSARQSQKRRELAAAPLLQIENLDSAQATAQVPPQRKGLPLYSRGLMIIVGCLLLALGVYLGRELLRLQAIGSRATGQVIALRAESDSDGGTLYRPIVRFNRGTTDTQFADGLASNPPLYHEGDRVIVLYEAGAAERTARIDRGMWSWLPSMLAGLFGIVLALAGISLPGANGVPSVRTQRDLTA